MGRRGERAAGVQRSLYLFAVACPKCAHAWLVRYLLPVRCVLLIPLSPVTSSACWLSAPLQVHHALKLCCWINTIERRDFSPPYVDKVRGPSCLPQQKLGQLQWRVFMRRLVARLLLCRQAPTGLPLPLHPALCPPGLVRQARVLPVKAGWRPHSRGHRGTAPREWTRGGWVGGWDTRGGLEVSWRALQTTACHPAAVATVRRTSQDWEEEYERVLAGWRGVQEGLPSSVERHEGLGLAVLRLQQPLHYYSAWSWAIGCDTVLTVLPWQRYELESR